MHIIRVEALHNSLYDGIMRQALCCKQDVPLQDMKSVSIFCMCVLHSRETEDKVFTKQSILSASIKSQDSL